MSSEIDDNGVHIESVDVNLKVKENGSMVENVCDSGLDTLDSCSAAFPASDSDVSPIKDVINNEFGHGASTDSLSNDSSLSSPATDELPDNLSFEYQKDNEVTKEIINGGTNVCDTGENDSSSYKQSEFDDRPLTTSTVSLNDHKSENNVMCKSPFSKSAENISNISYNDTISTSTEKELNADKILSEFVNQKAKASAVQKIPETLVNIDPKYTRIPKELLSQDIGSIVKNVHGIFSSVSGSLKSAYTHRTVYAQKPVKNVKNLPNGKVMNDIFEDENPESTEVLEKTEKANVEDPSMTIEIPTIKSLDSDDSESGDTKKDVLRLQIESLERLLAEQRKENGSLRDRVKQQCDELQQKDLTFKELEVKLDLVSYLFIFIPLLVIFAQHWDEVYSVI